MITLSIDLTQIDKSRFKRKTLKTGRDAVYCELVMFETPDRKFDNDFCVKQSMTKEDKANGVQMPIIGNGRIVGQFATKPQATPAAVESGEPKEGDDIPF